MQFNHKIIFTGGGSAGHVVPNFAIIDALPKQDTAIEYIGSTDGIEHTLCEQHLPDMPYHEIATGKLRRYFSWQNFIDQFLIMLGIGQAWKILRSQRPKVIFSKGGFVAFPVVFAAWLQGIPVIAHESDSTPGLANRMSLPFIKVLCISFAHTAKAFAGKKVQLEVTGSPIRKSLFKGNKQRGLDLCKFNGDKPVIMFIAGGSGSKIINDALRQALPQLLNTYQILHICGKDQYMPSSQAGYCQFEYVDAELADCFAAADLVVSRAGANSLFELLALQKPHILIPLSTQASRGDQVHNAAHFAEQGVSVVLPEEKLSAESLQQCIEQTMLRRAELQRSLANLNISNGTDKIVKLLLEKLNESN